MPAFYFTVDERVKSVYYIDARDEREAKEKFEKKEYDRQIFTDIREQEIIKIETDSDIHG